MSQDTIVALSSGNLPSGVAVIRVSGSECRNIAIAFTGPLPKPRIASLRPIVDPETQEILDKGLVLWFPGPESFTGEDCLEFHVHGGRAVVNAILGALCRVEDVRLAQAGEFSRRAFENGKLDLTELEGIGDLVASETEVQRRQALRQSRGDLREIYEAWRTRLVHMRAMIEAELDFADEEDVPDDISREGFSRVKVLRNEIKEHLDDNKAGEIIRDGFSIALMGKPNAGKSSLLNTLAKRDVAIVTQEAGTTRDVLDVYLDINGYSVIVSDTAGLRESSNIVEQEGIKRAIRRAEEADLIIWLSDINDEDAKPDIEHESILQIHSKDDGGIKEVNSISVKTGHGLDKLEEHLADVIDDRLGNRENALISRMRYREALHECLVYLDHVLDNESLDIDLKAEQLRYASDCIGKITGRVDVEDLLDVIFSEFCVGK